MAEYIEREATCEDCVHYDICIFHLKGNENKKCVQGDLSQHATDKKFIRRKNKNARYGKSLERIKKAARKRKPTEEQKAKTSASMKLYRQKERAEKGYCDNGKRGGAKMDGKEQDDGK